MVRTASIVLKTQGNAQVIDITAQVAQTIHDGGLLNGIVTVMSHRTWASVRLRRHAGASRVVA